MTRGSSVLDVIDREWGPDDASAVVILEPAGIGECDRCHRAPVRIYDVGPMDEGAWQECEPCIRLQAARRSSR